MKGLPIKGIYENMVNTLYDDCPSNFTKKIDCRKYRCSIWIEAEENADVIPTSLIMFIIKFLYQKLWWFLIILIESDWDCSKVLKIYIILLLSHTRPITNNLKFHSSIIASSRNLLKHSNPFINITIWSLLINK